jgi:hypothetical protein
MLQRSINNKEWNFFLRSAGVLFVRVRHGEPLHYFRNRYHPVLPTTHAKRAPDFVGGRELKIRVRFLLHPRGCFEASPTPVGGAALHIRQSRETIPQAWGK